MSSTNRQKKADPFDYFPTPYWMVHRLFDKLVLPEGHWIEPCAGDGQIIRAASLYSSTVMEWTAIEIQERFRTELEGLASRAVVIGDATLQATYPGGHVFDVAITNPPFEYAEKIVRALLILAKHVVILQRLNWLAGPRASFVRRLMPDVYVLPDRCAFDARGSDSIEYAWMHWGPERWPNVPGKIHMLGETPLHVRQTQRAQAIATMVRYGFDPMRGKKKRAPQE